MVEQKAVSMVACLVLTRAGLRAALLAGLMAASMGLMLVEHWVALSVVLSAASKVLQMAGWMVAQTAA